MAFKITATNTFREIFGGIDGGRILDVACGAGQFIEILQDSLKSWNEIFGMDVDAQYLNEARQKYPGDCYRFVVGNSEQIPYPANVFNLVSISKGLHHIKDPGLVLKEMKRVLIPGGYLVINEMYSDRLSESQNSQKLYHHLRAEVDNMLGIHHFYTLRKKEIIHFAESLKLTGILVYEYIENQDDPLNIDKIKEYSDKLDSWLVQLKDHEKLNYFKERIRELKERFRKVGITRPPQLVIVGRKPSWKGYSPDESQSPGE